MIFVDTRGWIARFDKRDQYHQEAMEKWEQLELERPQIFTSNLVLAETLTLVARKKSHSFAAGQADALYRSIALKVLRSNDEDEVRAVSFFRKFADQRVSFTDCVSFVLMQKNNIERVLAFDRHYQLAGFSPY